MVSGGAKCLEALLFLPLPLDLGRLAYLFSKLLESQSLAEIWIYSLYQRLTNN